MLKNIILGVLIAMIVMPCIDLIFFQIYESVIKIIVGIILFITLYRTNDLSDCTKKEFAFPIAIAFGLLYITKRDYSTLVVFFMYVINGALDIFETENED